jgi:hypothetical protein
MSAATSTQWTELYRETVGFFAASDILNHSPVTYAATASGDWSVRPYPVGSAALEFVGIARDDAAQGKAVTVYDGPGSIIRVVAGATVFQGQNVALAGATNYTHPISGNAATTVFYGPISGASGFGYNRIGVSLEFANPGELFALRVSPSQLSGLS